MHLLLLRLSCFQFHHAIAMKLKLCSVFMAAYTTSLVFVVLLMLRKEKMKDKLSNVARYNYIEEDIRLKLKTFDLNKAGDR